MAKKRGATKSMPGEIRKLRALLVLASFLPALFGGLLLFGTIADRYEIWPQSTFYILIGLSVAMIVLAIIAIGAVILLTLKWPFVRILIWVLAVAWLIFGILQVSHLIISQTANRNESLDLLSITRSLLGLLIGVSFIKSLLSPELGAFLGKGRKAPTELPEEDSVDDGTKKAQRRARPDAPSDDKLLDPKTVPDGPVTVACSNCQKRLRIPAALNGKRVKCPQCKSVFVAD